MVTCLYLAHLHPNLLPPLRLAPRPRKLPSCNTQPPQEGPGTPPMPQEEPTLPGRCPGLQPTAQLLRPAQSPRGHARLLEPSPGPSLQTLPSSSTSSAPPSSQGPDSGLRHAYPNPASSREAVRLALWTAVCSPRLPGTHSPLIPQDFSAGGFSVEDINPKCTVQSKIPPSCF